MVRNLATTSLVEILVAFSVVTGFPLLALGGRHITVSLFELDGPLGLSARAVGTTLSAGVFGLAAYVMFKHGNDLKSWGENTMVMQLPLWPFAIALSVLLFLSSLAFFVSSEVEAENTFGTEV